MIKHKLEEWVGISAICAEPVKIHINDTNTTLIAWSGKLMSVEAAIAITARIYHMIYCTPKMKTYVAKSLTNIIFELGNEPYILHPGSFSYWMPECKQEVQATNIVDITNLEINYI